MALYDGKAPGVYIQEIPGGVRPIQAVGTSTAGFVGVVKSPAAPVNQAIPINNWLQFRRVFQLDKAVVRVAKEEAETAVKTAQDAADAAQAAAAAAKAGSDAETKTKEALQKAAEEAKAAAAAASAAAQPIQTYFASFDNESQSTDLTHAVYGFFQNGGGRCYVVNMGSADASLEDALAKLRPIDEIAIVAAPGYATLAGYQALIGHCEEMLDRVAICDAPRLVGSETIDLLKETATAVKKGKPPQSDYATFYFPWIKVRDPLDPRSKEPVAVAPSGYMAGVWARTDNTRGVHKAPANEPVLGALDLDYHLTSQEQGGLNMLGVNCIRYFADSGILVWGARTVAQNPEWRYLNVRRLFNMIEESIVNSTRWIVFEPNDRPLWKAIRRDVEAFLTRIWRTGALMGRTPEEAFFVKCDEETNPPEEIDAGKVNIMIGVAPVKPAEFVVFQISQYESGTDVEVQGG